MSPSRKAAKAAPKPARAAKPPARSTPKKPPPPTPKPETPPLAPKAVAKPAAPKPAKKALAPKLQAPAAPPTPPPPPPPAEIHAEAVVMAPPFRVWAALTSPDEINRWFTDRCEFEARPNGRVLYAWFGDPGNPPAYIQRSRFDPAAEARVEAWEPRNRFSVRPTTRWPGLVTFRLVEDAGRTRVMVDHTGWPAKDAYFKEQEKSWMEALELLKLYLEKPEAEFDAHIAKLEARRA